ncbi:hypothetical protein ACFL27_05560 [candidate division CSSED10-310 bacterium]|uniref:Zinc ribbon domain-containing protein n=1 Tax=candidate division CSSED10-310 bacterium TaxID=2855610 RepID=A0ABV6YTZ8_UNCC1
MIYHKFEYIFVPNVMGPFQKRLAIALFLMGFIFSLFLIYQFSFSDRDRIVVKNTLALEPETDEEEQSSQNRGLDGRQAQRAWQIFLIIEFFGGGILIAVAFMLFVMYCLYGGQLVSHSEFSRLMKLGTWNLEHDSRSLDRELEKYDPPIDNTIPEKLITSRDQPQKQTTGAEKKIQKTAAFGRCSHCNAKVDEITAKCPWCGSDLP